MALQVGPLSARFMRFAVSDDTMQPPTIGACGALALNLAVTATTIHAIRPLLWVGPNLEPLLSPVGRFYLGVGEGGLLLVSGICGSVVVAAARWLAPHVAVRTIVAAAIFHLLAFLPAPGALTQAIFVPGKLG